MQLLLSHEPNFLSDSSSKSCSQEESWIFSLFQRVEEYCSKQAVCQDKMFQILFSTFWLFSTFMGVGAGMQAFSQGHRALHICCKASQGRSMNELSLQAQVKAQALISSHGFILPVCTPRSLTSPWDLFTDFVDCSSISSNSFHVMYPSQFHKPDSEEMAQLYSSIKGNLNRSEHHYLIHNPPNMLEWGTFRTLVLNHWGNMNLLKLNEIYRYSLKDNIHKILQTISGNSQLFRDFSCIIKVGYYINPLINDQNLPLRA